jgi:DTW domain-containing protein YfiP
MSVERLLISRSVLCRALDRLDYSSHDRLEVAPPNASAGDHAYPLLLSIARDYQFAHSALVRFPGLAHEHPKRLQRFARAADQISRNLKRIIAANNIAFNATSPSPSDAAAYSPLIAIVFSYGFSLLDLFHSQSSAQLHAESRRLYEQSLSSLIQLHNQAQMEIPAHSASSPSHDPLSGSASVSVSFSAPLCSHSLSFLFPSFHIFSRSVISSQRDRFLSSSPFESFRLSPRTVEFDSSQSLSRSSSSKHRPSQAASKASVTLPLHQLPRVNCSVCRRVSQIYCPDCLSIVQPLLLSRSILPVVNLPLDIEIIDASNQPALSTARHALILSQFRHSRPLERIHSQPPPFDPATTLCVFPGPEARPLEQFDPTELKSINRVVFLEGSWSEAAALARHRNIARLPFVTLQPPEATRFWRFQSLGPHFMSSIEAIRQFFVEWRQALAASSDGEFDDLLWIFSLTHAKYCDLLREHESLLPELGWEFQAQDDQAP